MHEPAFKPAAETCLDLADLFGNSNSVELELGFGKGRFLIQSASAKPQRNWLGVERARKYFNETRRRAMRVASPNLRLVRIEAIEFLREHLPCASLEAVHIYYPDPWPKRRHHRRRIVNTALLDQAERCLQPGGLLRIVTDHADYATWIAHHLAARERLTAIAWDDEEVITHFHVKYEKERRDVHRFLLRRSEES